jgi:hypothetical protein
MGAGVAVAVNVDAALAGLNPFAESATLVILGPCNVGHWFFRIEHGIDVPRSQVRGKIILLRVAEIVSLMRLRYAALIVPVPDLQALRLVEFGGRIPREIVTMEDRPDNPPRDFHGGQFESTPRFFLAFAARRSWLRGGSFASQRFCNRPELTLQGFD